MSNDTITQDVFELTLARPVVVEGGFETSLVNVWWRAPDQGNRLVQIYVDDELHDVSIDAQQRSVWLLLDRSRMHRIELLAVPADDVDALVTPHISMLQCWSPAVQDVASVSLLRDEILPIDTSICVSVDGQDLDRGLLWPADEHRSGFGAVFGVGAFGFDDATGPGLGIGELAAGALGSGGNAWRWRRDDLTNGDHDLTFAAEDSAGRSVADPIQQSDVTIETLPPPVTNLSISDSFQLSWSN